MPLKPQGRRAKYSPSHREPFQRKVPLKAWILTAFLYALPVIILFLWLEISSSLVLRLWLYTALLLPGMLLCYYLGFKGALLAIIINTPMLFTQAWQAYSGRFEHAFVLLSHSMLLFIALFLTGVLAEKLKRQEEAMKRLSVTDELTGLFNHRFFYQCLEKEADRARRYRHPLTLVIIDLDNFKKYNDTWGHIQGDRALATAAAVLKSAVRSTDIVARYGGEEFAIILPMTDLVSAKVICERIRESLAATPIPAGKGSTEPLTASFGAVSLESTMTAEQLVKEADKILYFAKNCGKNLVTCR